ncbi:tetratricopeptide repeat protein [Erythrobacter sp. YT30]|uniref:tetratricopeptide repeat protein n=1 Tax=Erythrobacter sp. YT30 TaxID=1735012 RepID=UPI00076DD562|nr:tetratricopeptide repeat protein [Erythrobacter sp. YT30]KWV91742.1 hypothetical protein AUC45_11090 [Erythrobacter sp. YT30]
MHRVFFFLLSCALVFGVLVPSEQAHAQSTSGTISIYTYRTVTTRLTNENERLSGVAVTERKNAEAADRRWRSAKRLLRQARVSGKASKKRVEQLETEAAAREAEFESTIEALNAQLSALDDQFRRMLRAATVAGTDLLQSTEGKRALELIALGGEANTEAGIQILLAEQDIRDQVEKLRIADRARSIAVTLLGLKGTAPSATTAAIIEQYEVVTENDPERHWDWVELKRLYFDAGRLAEAMRAARRSLETASNDRQKSTALNALGEVQKATGDLAGARQSHMMSLAITKGMAAAQPKSIMIKRDLVVDYLKIGTVQKAQGDFTGAQESFSEALKITQGIAHANPSLAFPQLDLMASYGRIGDLQIARRDLTGARQSYDEILEIAKKLVAADPSSASLQRSLMVGHTKIGDIQLAENDLNGASESYSKSLEILEKLTQGDVSSVNLKRDLAVTFDKTGDVQFKKGDLAAALESYNKALGIRQDLEALNLSPSYLKRDLFLSHHSIGKLLAAQGDTMAAQMSYEKGIAILDELIANDSSSARLKLDLANSIDLIGDLQTSQRNLTGARESYRRALIIREGLAKTNPNSAILRRRLTLSYWRLADLDDPSFPWSRVVGWFEKMKRDGLSAPGDGRFLEEARRLAKEQGGL